MEASVEHWAQSFGAQCSTRWPRAQSFVLRQVSETPTQAQRRLDPFGQLTSILAVTALTFGLIEGGVQSFHAPLIQAAFGVALICFVAFLFIEARGYAPMLPPRLLANSTISAGLLAGALLDFVYSGLLFVLSLFFQQVRSYSPLLAGLAFLPLTLVLTINPTFTGRLVGRFGARIPLTLGFFLAASGVLMQIWTNAHTGLGHSSHVNAGATSRFGGNLVSASASRSVV